MNGEYVLIWKWSWPVSSNDWRDRGNCVNQPSFDSSPSKYKCIKLLAEDGQPQIETTWTGSRFAGNDTQST